MCCPALLVCLSSFSVGFLWGIALGGLEASQLRFLALLAPGSGGDSFGVFGPRASRLGRFTSPFSSSQRRLG